MTLFCFFARRVLHADFILHRLRIFSGDDSNVASPARLILSRDISLGAVLWAPAISCIVAQTLTSMTATGKHGLKISNC